MSLDLFGGVLLAIQVLLYNRVLPFFAAYVLTSEFKPKVMGVVVILIYIFNLLMLISSSAKVYTGFKAQDEKEKRYHYAMVIAGIIVVMLFNIIAEVLMIKFRIR